MENLLVENEIFCDLDSIKLDLDSDLFDLSPFEFERAAATAATAADETVGEAADAAAADPFGDVGKPKIEAVVDAVVGSLPVTNNDRNNSDGANGAKEAFSSLSSLLSPPSTPVITSNNTLHPPPSWNLESLLKSRQQQQQQHQSSLSPSDGVFTPFDRQPPPPNKNIINHQDKNVIQQILDGLKQQQQQQQSPSSSSLSSSPSSSAVGTTTHVQQRRPVVVVSAIRDEPHNKNSLPKFKLEMIKEAPSSSSTSSSIALPHHQQQQQPQQQQQQPTASRTLVPETNHPIMLHKPLIAKDQKTGSLQLLPESLVNMDGRILSLGDLLSASGLHKNLICNLDIRPPTTTTATPPGSLTPPISSAAASSLNFGQYPQPQPPESSSSSSSSSPSSKTTDTGNDHSSHGLVHKLLASPINQLIQPWHMHQQQRQQASGSSFDSASTINQSKPGSDAAAAAAAATLFPANHSAFALRKPDPKSKILAEATSLENVFPESFSNKTSSPLTSAKNGAAAANNWGGGGLAGGGGGGLGGGGAGEPATNAKTSPENSLRSVIKNKIIQAKQQTALKSAAPPVVVKREVDSAVSAAVGIANVESSVVPSFSAVEDLKSRAAEVGVFMEGERGGGDSAAGGPFEGRGAISMPASPVSFNGERESFFDAFVKTDLDEIIPEPLDNDCIICGVAFQTQAALRDHLEEHRDHISMIQSGGGGGGQSASLIDSPPYSSNSSVVGSDDVNNGTSSGCPSMADAAEFYVNTSMPASPASSTSSLDQLLVTTASPVRGGANNNNAANNFASGIGSNKKVDSGSTLASLLVSNISPLLTSLDGAAQQLKSGVVQNRHHSPIYPNQRATNQGFGQNLLVGSTVGGNNSNNNNAIQRNGFVASLFQQHQQNGGGMTGAKWKKAGLSSGVSMSALLGGVGGAGSTAAASLVNDPPQFYGKIMNGDHHHHHQKMMVKTTVDGIAKVGQKRKLTGMAGMGVSKSCPVSPTMKDMMMGVMAGVHASSEGGGGGQGGGANGAGGIAGSDLIAGHQGPKTKKCRRVYGLNQKNLWCTQCQWKKACARFKPPKQ